MGWHSRGRDDQASGVGASLVSHCIQDVGSVCGWEGVRGRCQQVKDLYFLPCSLVEGTVGEVPCFPVESCTKQTQIPAKPRMVYLEQRSFSLNT